MQTDKTHTHINYSKDLVFNHLKALCGQPFAFDLNLNSGFDQASWKTSTIYLYHLSKALALIRGFSQI